MEGEAIVDDGGRKSAAEKKREWRLKVKSRDALKYKETKEKDRLRK
jgi:hypothetical protein